MPCWRRQWVAPWSRIRTNAEIGFSEVEVKTMSRPEEKNVVGDRHGREMYQLPSMAASADSPRFVASTDEVIYFEARGSAMPEPLISLPRTHRLEDFSDAAFSIASRHSFWKFIALTPHGQIAGSSPNGVIFLLGILGRVHLCRRYLAQPSLLVRTLAKSGPVSQLDQSRYHRNSGVDTLSDGGAC